MGMEIRCHIESKRKDLWFTFACPILPRNGEVFARIGNKRSSMDDPELQIFPAKGFPKDPSPQAFDSMFHNGGNLLTNLHNSTIENWMADGHSKIYEIDGEKYISDPAYYSHTWLTPDEWEQVIAVDAHPEYRAALAAMRSLEKDGRETRIVIWFT
jgi:hypothetical protein